MSQSAHSHLCWQHADNDCGWLQWCINGEGSLFHSTTIHTSRGRAVQQMQSLTRWKLLFPSENQKDKNNAPFMILESRKRNWTCCILFSYSYRLLLTSTENPGTLMFKKKQRKPTIIIFYWNQLQAMQLVTEKDLMKSDFALSQNSLTWVKWDHSNPTVLCRQFTRFFIVCWGQDMYKYIQHNLHGSFQEYTLNEDVW